MRRKMRQNKKRQVPDEASFYLVTSMLQLKRKKSFIAPFSQTSSISSQNADVQAKLPQHGEEKRTFSPVHLGHNVQIITPHTRQKIKQRVALGLSHVCVRDMSPGIHVPFDLSQASCISQSRIEEKPDHKEKEPAEVELEKVHIANDDHMQGFEEEYDLGLLDEVTDIEVTVKENGNIAEFTEATVMNQEYDQAIEPREMEPSLVPKKHKKNNVGPGVNDENNQQSNLNSKKESQRQKAKENPKILKTKMFGQSCVRKKTLLKQKRQFCKSDNAAKNISGIGDTAQFRKITQRRGDILLTQVNIKASCGRKDVIEVSDFCPLASPHSSQNVANCKRKKKRSFQMMKHEVLKTLTKMHNEIQELLERRKLLDKSGDTFGRQKISSELHLHSMQRKQDVVQEE